MPSEFPLHSSFSGAWTGVLGLSRALISTTQVHAPVEPSLTDSQFYRRSGPGSRLVAGAIHDLLDDGRQVRRALAFGGLPYDGPGLGRPGNRGARARSARDVVASGRERRRIV